MIAAPVLRLNVSDYSSKYAERKHASTETLRNRFHRFVNNSKYGVERVNQHVSLLRKQTKPIPWATIVAKSISPTRPGVPTQKLQI